MQATHFVKHAVRIVERTVHARTANTLTVNTGIWHEPLFQREVV